MTIIISPEERLAEQLGAHILLAGRAGDGKTRQTATLDPSSTIYIDTDHGVLSIANIPMLHIRPETWPEIQDLIVRIAGPNRSFLPQEAYSQAHFDRCGGFLPGIENRQIVSVVLDSLTSTSRLCFRWASQQPEAFTERGKLDLRSVYGLKARELLLALHHVQSARGLNIIIICALETVADEYGHAEHKLQVEGQRAPRELPGIFDVVVTLAWIDFGDGKPAQVFVCNSPNPWQFPGKDRSGKLDQLEPPDLGKLIRKILPPRANHGEAVVVQPSQSTIVQAQSREEKQL
jgi:hypothetical protein